MRRQLSHLPAWLVFSVVLIGLTCAGAFATVEFSGALTDLSNPPGLDPFGAWASQGFDIVGWDVSQNPDGSWRYVYGLTVPTLDAQHFIVELPSGATVADIKNATGTFTSFSVGQFAPGPTFPFLPGNIFGADFLVNQNSSTLVAFDANIAPSFGNFYAQGNQDIGNAVFNDGFLIPDAGQSPVNGSVNHKLLVPNPTQPIPDASTVVLACFGILQLLAVKERIFRSVRED
jgi:hypothetical protein